MSPWFGARTCQSSNKDPEQPLQFQCLPGRGLCECDMQPLVSWEGPCPKVEGPDSRKVSM